MQVNSIVSSKGGVGKTTTSANLGGIAADAGLKTLLIDLDGQPTLSSYFPLEYQAPGGTFDLLVHSNTTPEKIISRTNIPGLDIILSNDPHTSSKPCSCMPPMAACAYDHCSSVCLPMIW
jgi:chromosome partitioning related protein ParA